jgi:mannose-6-phosphate isomerase-like protein (cupin superfamily)
MSGDEREATRVAFEAMPWQTSPVGVRFKLRQIGAQQLRLLEFSRDLDHPHWCTTGHVGYVVEGAMEVEFEDGRIVYQAGDGVAIPAGEGDKHRPRALSDRVRLVFIEDAADPSSAGR